jgi:hypothetical protein
MRNLSFQIRKNQIVGLYRPDLMSLAIKQEAEKLLCRAMEATRSSWSPSEEETVTHLLSWWEAALSNDDPYDAAFPSFVYVNVNTGVALVFTLCVDHEGGVHQTIHDSSTRRFYASRLV